MTREEAIDILRSYLMFDKSNMQIDIALNMAIEALSAEADCSTCKHKDKDWDSEECDSCCGNNNHYASADAVSEDTQTEEQARFVAKETELAHIEARLENAEKRLQGVCVANFVAEQLERLREMTDEERWEFFKRFFEVEGGDDE